LLAATGFRLTTAIPFLASKTATGRKENWAILECVPQDLSAKRSGKKTSSRMGGKIS